MGLSKSCSLFSLYTDKASTQIPTYLLRGNVKGYCTEIYFGVVFDAWENKKYSWNINKTTF